MPNFASELKRRLLALLSARDQNPEGASEEEIHELEAYAGGPLPAVYREFLAELGRSAGALFRATEYSVRQRCHLRLRESAERILKHGNASFVLPDTAFVFLMTSGTQFSFFYRNQGDDPAVFHYNEIDPAPKQLDTKLSNYLLRCVEQVERLNAAVHPVCN